MSVPLGVVVTYVPGAVEDSRSLLPVLVLDA
jgi:hypothetical protein